MLDGLFDQDTILDIQEHFTDTGGASDHVFGLFALIGKRFAPPLRNLKDRKFHTFEKGDAYPALINHIGAPINTALIIDHWDDLLHLAASITTRAVVPSTILKKLSASPKEGQLAKALRELGRIERSLFMIEWYSSPALRRRCQAGLNKGEAAHKLKRAVFFHERGEIRDRSFESQAFRASGLNLVVSAIVHWNTVYIERAVAHLRKARRAIPDNLLKHISPLSWEHINLGTVLVPTPRTCGPHGETRGHLSRFSSPKWRKQVRSRCPRPSRPAASGSRRPPSRHGRRPGTGSGSR